MFWILQDDEYAGSTVADGFVFLKASFACLKAGYSCGGNRWAMRVPYVHVSCESVLSIMLSVTWTRSCRAEWGVCSLQWVNDRRLPKYKPCFSVDQMASRFSCVFFAEALSEVHRNAWRVGSGFSHVKGSWVASCASLSWMFWSARETCQPASSCTNMDRLRELAVLHTRGIMALSHTGRRLWQKSWWCTT